MAWARAKNIRIISTAHIQRNNNGNGKINYCIEGTDGQKKIRYTLRSRRISFAADNRTDLPRDILQQYDQVILHKRHIDPFAEPRLDRLLSEVRADEFILIGASTEDAIKSTALGLLQRRKNVSIVVDAIGSHDKGKADLALKKAQAKGAKLIETKSLAKTSHLKKVGICRCDRCQSVTKKETVKAQAG